MSAKGFVFTAGAILLTTLLIYATWASPVQASDLNFQLLNAADAGNVELCKSLIAAGANPGTAAATGALTPLMTATAKGHTEVVRLFLQAGADPNVRAETHWNRTALMWAVDKQPTDKTVEVVRLLLDAGADAALKDSEGRTALALAMKYAGETKGKEVVALLTEKVQTTRSTAESPRQGAPVTTPK